MKPAASRKLEAFQFILLFVLILAGRSSLADHYYVPSGSMQHTLQEGDRVFVNKAAYGVRVPFTYWRITESVPVGRGDIVIVDAPDTGVRLIKRVAAIGGDQIVLSGGKLYVNGERQLIAGEANAELVGEHKALLNLEHGGGPNIPGLTVPQGKLLLLGDHRGKSRDSRYFGMVDESSVYGNAIAVYYRKSTGFSWIRL